MESIKNKQLITVLCEPGEGTLAVHNPATGQLLGHIPTQSEAEIQQAIAKSHLAQQQWRQKTAKERAVLLHRWFTLIMDNQDDLATLMTLEQGKPRKEAAGEVAYGASFIEWFAEEAKRTYGETVPSPFADRRILTIRQPVGVACVITPWNFPIAMLTRKAGPALAAGCTVVAKPASQTPLCAYAVAELAYEAGIPRDVLQLVTHSSARTVGDLFCASPLVRKISFTGSTQVGRQLMAQCADSVKRLSLELGGNAPFIVFDDADIDKAVQGAVASKYRNAGQTCVCANRLFAQRGIYEEFVTKLAKAVQKLNVGNGLDDDVAIGPVIDDSAKAKINRLMHDAISHGARLVTGGEDREGLFVSPAVLADVRPEMAIAQEEVFGPIAPVIAFDDEAALFTQANDTIFGLAAYFYSRDIGRIWRVAEALEYGMVGINEGIISTEVAPFGGVKQSGFGREGGRQGIEEYMDIKYLCMGGLDS
ncbi:NAD-dependent succinate-semialdehyde dehydrogenase [Photobacterium sp. R1]